MGKNIFIKTKLGALVNIDDISTISPDKDGNAILKLKEGKDHVIHMVNDFAKLSKDLNCLVHIMPY